MPIPFYKGSKQVFKTHFIPSENRFVNLKYTVIESQLNVFFGSVLNFEYMKNSYFTSSMSFKSIFYVLRVFSDHVS